MDESTKDDAQATNAKSIPVVNDITPPPAAEQTVNTSDEEAATQPAGSDQVDTTPTVIAVTADEQVQNENDPNQIEGLTTLPEERSSAEEPASSDGVVAAPPDSEEEAQSVSSDETTPSVYGQTSSLEDTSQAQQTVDDTQKTALNESVLSNNTQAETSHDPATMAEVGVSASQMNKQPHRNNRKLAAVITVIVAVLLAGVAVYVYMSANKNAEESTATSTNQDVVEKKEVAPATASDVDATNAAVDEAVNALDESADFADSDLSDSSLGL